MKLIVACVPAYNEEKTIAKVVLLAQKCADKVVVCDDGSNDLTAEIAEKLGATVIRHRKNMGYGRALKSLFAEVAELDADVMLTLDADGQHDAKEIPRLVQPILDDKADIVIGSRFLGEKNDVPTYRRLGIRFITMLSGRPNGGELSDAQSGFRAYNKKAVRSLILNEKGMGASAEILLRAKRKGLRVAEVPVSTRYQGLDTSTHNWVKHGFSVIASIVRLVVEDKPLFFLGIPGIVFLSAGTFFGLMMLRIFASKGYIETNVALASIAFVLIGIFSIFTAITLYAIQLTRKRIERSR